MPIIHKIISRVKCAISKHQKVVDKKIETGSGCITFWHCKHCSKDNYRDR